VTEPLQLIFTAVSGRSGQASLVRLINAFARDCYAELEPPDLIVRRRGRLGSWLETLQRRYITTHEMLGRGQALRWYDDSLEDRLDHLVRKRMRRIFRLQRSKGFRTYFEVSKFFMRTLHEATLRQAPNLSLLKLTRDPIRNARSFANRTTNFLRDNPLPNAKRVCLRMDPAALSPFQLYLWSWCEMELRTERFVCKHGLRCFALRTEEIDVPERVAAMCEFFGIAHGPIQSIGRVNTNAERGLPDTRVQPQDLVEFDSFLDKIPSVLRDEIQYLRDYRPASFCGGVG
jgi:hypothetical protein